MEQQSRPLHTIALDATRGLEVTKKGIRLKAEVAAKVREHLVLCYGSPDLDWAIRSLLMLAARLEKRSGAEAANVLVAIACSATQPLNKLASESSARTRRVRMQRSAQFLGSAPEKMVVATGKKNSRVVVNQLMKMPRRA